MPCAPTGLNDRRTNATAPARTTKDTALNAIVHAGPTNSTNAVPNIGPMMRPLFHEYTPSETIAIISSGGTRSGNIAA